ncbi:MAG TPA: hypothetical protein VK698_30445 [Kofleriaceae bacterium]|nr:hypothetical protein [Kofleriaceae bacterium]
MTGRLRATLPAALPVALALVAGLAAHIGGAWNGFTNWDDPGYLLDNPLTVRPLADGVQGLLGTTRLGYPVPVTVLFYAVERGLYGLEACAFHLVSIGLHLICVALVWRLARRLGAGAWAAAGAAAIFAVHPVAVEPVAWVVGQKDLLAAALLLAALVVRSRPDGAGGRASALVGLLAVLAIGAKPSAVAAVVLIPGLDLALGRRIDRAGAALIAVVAAAAITSTGLSLVGHGFVGGEPPAPFGARSLAAALWSVWLQAQHLVWPDPLLARYFPPDGAALAAGAAVGALLIAAVIGGAVMAWRRGRRAVAFSLAGALVAYAPVSGLVPLSRGAADSYLYLPLALGTLGLALGLTGVAARRRIVVGGAIVAAIALALGAVSVRQTAMWRDSPSLWAPVARAYPDDPRALMRLGDAHLFTGDLGGAVREYEALHRRFPDFATSLPAHAAALDGLGRAAEAEALLALAVRLDPREPNLEGYGFFLATHEIAPGDDRAAHLSIITVGRLLAARGKRPATVRRAARLLRGYGEVALAAALERRLAELEQRRR